MNKLLVYIKDDIAKREEELKLVKSVCGPDGDRYVPNIFSPLPFTMVLLPE